MPKRNIILSKGYYYHIYNRAVSDTLLFPDQNKYQFFLSRIKKHLLESIEILAYCLMPNHYHLLALAINDELPQAMQKFALSYVVPYNLNYNRKGHLFQGPYQIKLVDSDRYLVHLSRYIHLNPVAAGIVKDPASWIFSSYREYTGEKGPDIVNPNLILDILDENRGSPLSQKRQEYKRFFDEWDPDYMEFKIK